MNYPLKQDLETVIALYQSGLSCNQIGERYGTAGNSVWTILHRHGITLRAKETPLSDNSEDVIRAYKCGLSLSQVGLRYGVSGSAVRSFLRRRDIPRRGPHSFRKYTIDHHIFDTIDAPSKAYWLGFLFGDGTTSHRNGFLAVAPLQDRGHLEELKHFLNSDAPIKPHQCLRSLNLAIHSVHLGNHLRALGLSPERATTMCLPNIPDGLLRFFILGFFDAEGSFSGAPTPTGKRVLQIEFGQRSPIILNQIATHISHKTGVIKSVRPRPNGNHRLCYTGKKAKTVLKYLYQGNEDLALARKFQQYARALSVEGCYA